MTSITQKIPHIHDQRVSATILAGLRLLQHAAHTPTAIGAQFPDHFAEVDPLSAAQIDDLCEIINCTPSSVAQAVQLLLTPAELQYLVNLFDAEVQFDPESQHLEEAPPASLITKLQYFTLAEFDRPTRPDEIAHDALEVALAHVQNVLGVSEHFAVQYFSPSNSRRSRMMRTLQKYIEAEQANRASPAKRFLLVKTRGSSKHLTHEQAFTFLEEHWAQIDDTTLLPSETEIEDVLSAILERPDFNAQPTKTSDWILLRAPQRIPEDGLPLEEPRPYQRVFRMPFEETVYLTHAEARTLLTRYWDLTANEDSTPGPQRSTQIEACLYRLLTEPSAAVSVTESPNLSWFVTAASPSTRHSTPVRSGDTSPGSTQE